MRKLVAKIADWYEGRYVPFENDPNSPVIIIGGDWERHWTARVARAVLEFLSNHWQWTISVTIAVTGLVIAYLKLP